MRIIILGGFLGSGKTSVLLQLARYLVDREKDSPSEVKVAIIENEIGQVGIDDKILVNAGLNVNNLFAGCACCSLAGELVFTVKKIRDNLDPQWLIIEATGVAYPGAMQQSINEGFELNPYIMTIVDANRWKRLVRAMEMLIVGQLKDSSKVLLNKIDLVDEAEVAEISQSIHDFNRTVGIVPISAKDDLPADFWKKLIEELEASYENR